MSPKSAIRLSPVLPVLQERIHQARIGLIVLATDHTSEADYRRMVASDRIGVHVARIAYANPVTPENLRRMQPALTEAAALLLPDEDLDAICYSCTSASVVIGDDAVNEAISAAKPGTAVVTPTSAALAGLHALGARRISVLTPYTVETSQPMAEYFERQGMEIVRFSCLGMTDDRQMARIAPQSLFDAACEASDPAADALFVSCTALRAAGIANRIETAIGQPVVTSNQATAWQCLRMTGDTSSHGGYGRLFTQPLAGHPAPQSG